VDPLENLVALDYCRQLYIIDSQKVTMVEEKTEKKERKVAEKQVLQAHAELSERKQEEEDG
jgi:hypothetical protein